jgi:hypothetical protein
MEMKKFMIKLELTKKEEHTRLEDKVVNPTKQLHREYESECKFVCG